MLRLNVLKLSGWRLVAAIAAPLAAATIAIFVLTFDLLERATEGANETARRHTERIVNSALISLKDQVGKLVVDNAYWDDAVRNSYEGLTQDWVNETWGYSTRDGIAYQHMAIVDQDAKTAFIAFKDGEKVDIDPDYYYKGHLAQMIVAAAASTSLFKHETAIIPTADGLAVVGLGPITPVSKDVPVPTSPRYLVITQFIDAELMASLSRQYIVDGLEIKETFIAGEGVLITGPAGKITATATWKPPKPGDVVLKNVMPKALVTLGLLALVMAGLGFACWGLNMVLLEREAKTRHAAFHDSLTGLSNRVSLTAHLKECLRQKHIPTAVVFADIDGFKDVNDTYDHQVGDQLIVHLAELLRTISGPGTFLARIGGDEFVAVFTGSDCDAQAKIFADRFISELTAPIDLGGRYARIGASIGVASNKAGEVSDDELMRRADVAMYAAKQSGKNRQCAYSSSIDGERLGSQQIADQLRQIIKDRSIEVAYQPIVDATARHISAVEVLARWPKAATTYHAPDRFIAVAENSGLIDDLGAVILAKACDEAKEWGHVRLCFNVSPVQLRNPKFAERVLETVTAAGIDPSRVEVEITEQVLVDDLAQAGRVINALRAAGISVALDDFGSGHSSVGYLRKLSFDRIKIDRDVVKGIFSGRVEQGIAQGLSLMAMAMGASITAEGIESEDQAKMMRLLGCNEFQGFYFHKPMTGEQVVDQMLAELDLLLSGPEALSA